MYFQLSISLACLALFAPTQSAAEFLVNENVEILGNNKPHYANVGLGKNHVLYPRYTASESTEEITTITKTILTSKVASLGVETVVIPTSSAFDTVATVSNSISKPIITIPTTVNFLTSSSSLATPVIVTPLVVGLNQTVTYTDVVTEHGSTVIQTYTYCPGVTPTVPTSHLVPGKTTTVALTTCIPVVEGSVTRASTITTTVVTCPPTTATLSASTVKSSSLTTNSPPHIITNGTVPSTVLPQVNGASRVWNGIGSIAVAALVNMLL